MGCHFFLQGIFQTQGSNLCLLHLQHWQEGSLPPSHLGKPHGHHYSIVIGENTDFEVTETWVQIPALTLYAAAAANSLQSCPTLCSPIDGSPPGSPVPGILQARTLEWVAIFFSSAWKWKVKVKSLSRVWLFATPWTAAYQAPPPMGFSRQEYWSGVPLPSPWHCISPTKLLNFLTLSFFISDINIRMPTSQWDLFWRLNYQGHVFKVPRGQVLWLWHKTGA